MTLPFALYVQMFGLFADRQLHFTAAQAGYFLGFVGFLGIIWLGPVLRNTFHLPTGMCGLTGSLLLAFMALPTIIFGAVIDPAGLDKLLPDWRQDPDCPLQTQVTDDRFYWFTETGAIKPHVSHVFPLAEFKQAMRAKWSGEVVGGCVVHP